MNEPGPDRTLLQFSLRSLFVATLVVAALSALAAPWLRGLGAGQLSRLGILAGATLLLPLIYLVAVFFRRWDVDRKSGRLLLRVPVTPRKTWFHAACLFLILIGFTACFLLVSWNWVVKPGDYAWAFLPVLVPASLGNAGISHFVFMLCSRADSAPLEARQNGLILGAFRFVPWARIRNHLWDGPNLLHLTLHLKDENVTLRVRQRDKEPFDRLLREMGARQAGCQPTELAQR